MRRTWVAVLLAVAAVPLTATGAAATPTGPFIVFDSSTPGHSTYTIRDGEHGTDAKHPGVGAVISPDGSLIALLVGPKGHASVAVEARGSDDYQVISPGGYDWARWTARGLVGARTTSSGAHVFAVLDPTGATPPVDLPDVHDAIPVWSPDARFVADRNVTGGVLITDTAGRNPYLLSSTQVGYDVDPELWSPDGRRLAIQTDPCAGGSAMVDLVASRETTTVLPAAFRPWAVEPGGQRLIGVTEDVDDRCEDQADTLNAVDIDGSHLTKLADHTYGASVGGTVDATTDATAPGAVTELSATARPSLIDLSYRLPADADRAGVTIRYAIGDVAPASISDGLDGGEAYGPTAELRHLPPDTTYSIAVFSRDWSGHVGPVATVTTTTPHALADALTPMTDVGVPYGKRVTVRTRLTRLDDDAPQAGVRLVVRRTIGKRTRTVGTVTTSSKGIATYSTTITRRQKLTLLVRPSVDHSGASASEVVHAQPHITFLVPAQFPRSRHLIVTVKVTPAVLGPFQGQVSWYANGSQHVTLHFRDGVAHVDVGPFPYSHERLTAWVYGTNGGAEASRPVLRTAR